MKRVILASLFLLLFSVPVHAVTQPIQNCELQNRGDANCNNVVDSEDNGFWVTAYLQNLIPTGIKPDFNRDGKISLIDLEILIRNLGLSISPTPIASITPGASPTSGPSPTTGPSPTLIPGLTDIPVPTDIPEPTIPVIPTLTGPTPTPYPISGLAYYISPDGDDSADGKTLATAFKKFSVALPKLKPGDILYAREGYYDEEVTPSVTAGRADAKIIIKNYQNERPVIRGLLQLKGMKYWVIDGINVTWNASTGAANEHMVKFSGNENWELKNCEIWGARSFAGILVNGNSKDWSINNCVIHDTYKSNDTNQDHLIYVNEASFGIIERNVFIGSVNGRGVKMGPPSSGGPGPNNITVRYNTFYDNTGPSNIQVSGGTSTISILRNILIKPGGSNTNITRYEHSGTNVVVKENLGWLSTGVFPNGLTDGGGNVNNTVDPQITFNVPKRTDGSFIYDASSFKPANAAAAAYGKHAQ